MTMPHLMNCQHSSDGWCLECVKELHGQCEHWKSSYEELAKAVMSAPQEMQETLCDLAAGWHFCPEFDYLFIGPGCPEMESCTCQKEE